ncbi:MAG: hypothetical protein ABI758_04415 [Candidatus Woesebacteria bacterium]
MLPYNINSSVLIEKARLHAERSSKKLQREFPHAVKKLEQLHLHLKDLRRHSAKILSGAVIAGGLVLGTPSIATTVTHLQHQQKAVSPADADQALHDKLAAIIPKTIGPLPPSQEQDISNSIQQTLGIKAVAALDGNHLNTTYGRIGGEQHLPRFLGDKISDHDALQVKGITAGRGAFGYFAPSRAQMTQEAEMNEKYYVAVQTLYLPNWNHDYKTLKDWYKFRKVLVVNPSTGKSVVAVVGDAGPAAWTGKHFGGSPEVMDYLKPYANKNNGAVLLFFIDDIENPIALGPVNGSEVQYLARK